ncbi:TPA: glycosyltransferase family 2 protein [Klebsiella aerogenes]|uniref:Glycosyl transferase n=1 Tax=Klebsiella aerogenes TaxID=548 RepID=A0A346NTI9_KLEAE|nr:glycosyltransferase [Klebsiella aerogenes]AXR70582.1 glycosyl transferase [Klebsiella aerogenes]EIV6707783.1 glycosyltransferase family 2 protein [Klebsiella aerogenes]EIV9528936.1 glycosyltransferase family 2 protein [Klebsiella aerogenes]EIW8606896.1 glycosyltransferase family 2 protein [Klebsiella aerogenes]EKU8841970.1 glycosyltransferase family 2 protein [Klebsiella aerogenes]
MKYFIAIPTYNGGGLWHQTIKNITQYSPADVFVHVIDSSSKDDTASLASEAGFDILTIAGDDFNHGGTRNLAVKEYIDDYDVVIFLTQDAIPESGFIEEIISVFDDEEVASAYGRQLPHLNANPIARHARNFNYPTKGYVADKTSIAKMGLKTVFMSNSFSAYRLSVFKKLGGFPSDTILCEDMFYTAKAVMAGYKNVYAANAKVRHSHNYTPIEEFKRYFDIGVFHTDQPWIRDNFGGAGGEGTKFIISELKFLIANGISWLPLAMINNFMKIVGYKLGQNYKKLPKVIIKKCSMHKRFWKF